MGIKFRCPNGHKLNVKLFLAGKRGVCPDCGVTFRIPEEPGGSDIQASPLASLKGGNGAATGEPAPSEAVAQAVAEPISTQPMTTVAVVTPSAPVAAVPVPVASPAPVAVAAGTPLATGIPLPMNPAVMPASVAAPGIGPQAIPAAVPAAPLPGDPIAEAPAAIWYVRPPSGGQYGPARGDVMRKWIAEGRVSGDSLVWREGWTDWRNAGQLFPTLGAAGSAAAGALPGPAVTLPQTTRTATRYAARKKGGTGLAIAALVGLVLVCLVLVVVLVIVLTQQSA